MRIRRSALTLLAIPVLVAFCAPAVAQQDDSVDLSTKEINALEREIQTKERRLRRFDSAIGKLRTAGRQSSHSGARKAVEDTEKLMHEVISFEEQKLGEEYRITQRSEEVETVHTNDLTDARGVRTKSRRRHPLPPDTPPEYLRLVRLQDIYYTCQTLREHAIARTGEAPERYGNVILEFAEIMRTDLAELKAKLPEDTTPTYDSPYGIKPTTAEPDSD